MHTDAEASVVTRRSVQSAAVACLYQVWDSSPQADPREWHQTEDYWELLL